MSSSELLSASIPGPADPASERYFPYVAGALLASAAADALGWMTEFIRGKEHLKKTHGRDSITEYLTWKKKSGGRFNAYTDYINRGEYSDDTQLTLAVARSLRADGTLHMEHFSKQELPLWLDYARGAGATVTTAARAITRKSATWDNNFFNYRRGKGRIDYRTAGANGAAMRIAPIALANPREPSKVLVQTWQNAVVTHGHPRAIVGAVLHAEALRYTVDRSASGSVSHDLLDHLIKFCEDLRIPDHPSIQSWVRRWNEHRTETFAQGLARTKAEVLDGLGRARAAKTRTDAHRVMKTLGCFDRETKGSGTATVIGGLALFKALGTDLRPAVLEAVNLIGTDTDTIAAFVGGLSGAAHGYQAIPHEWTSELQDHEYFLRMAEEISRVAARQGIGGKALLPAESPSYAKLPSVLTLLREQEINQDERVYHPLFGPGWVRSVDAQTLRRRDGGEVVFARIAFDLGQNCKFRFMRLPGARQKSRPSPPTTPKSDQTLF